MPWKREGRRGSIEGSIEGDAKEGREEGRKGKDEERKRSAIFSKVEKSS